MSVAAFCPATMCPLFARDGSPWTGAKDAHCEGIACGWFDIEEGCQGAVAAYTQIGETLHMGGTLQLGPVQARRTEVKPSRSFDCPRAHECQWQLEQPEGQLCPPRFALAQGLDPRTCAW